MVAALKGIFWRTRLNAITNISRQYEDPQNQSTRAGFNPLHWVVSSVVLFAALFSSVAFALVQPTVTLSSRENPIAAGKGNFLIVRVQGGTGTSPLPRGTVRFTDSLTSAPLCAAATLSTGSIGNNTSEAACLFPANSAVGNHTIFVAYSGDSFYNAAGAPGLAQEVLPSYTVNAAAIGGTASPAVRTFVMRGFGVGFDFTADPGFRFVRVDTTTGCGGSQNAVPISATTYHFDSGAITANCTITGVFTNRAVVTPIADTGGQISPSTPQSLVFSSTLTVTVTPNAGFRLTNVNGCGIVFFGGPAITGPTTWTTAPVNNDCRVEAFFTALPTFTVTAAAGAGGSISPSSVAVAQGLTTTFNVTPASGFQIASVTGCGGTRSGSTYTTGPITAACAVTATVSVSATPPAVTTTRMIEFIFPALDYYFLTSRANEIALLDALPAFARTGQSFNVYINRVVGTQPITRFYFNKVALKGSRDGHFYTLVDGEISLLLGLNPGNIAAPKLPVSEGVDSFAFPPAVEGIGGSCPSGLIPVFRVFRGNVRFPDDPNHRFTTSTAIYNEFVAKGWEGEGVKLCVAG